MPNSIRFALIMTHLVIIWTSRCETSRYLLFEFKSKLKKSQKQSSLQKHKSNKLSIFKKNYNYANRIFQIPVISNGNSQRKLRHVCDLDSCAHSGGLEWRPSKRSPDRWNTDWIDCFIILPQVFFLSIIG